MKKIVPQGKIDRGWGLEINWSSNENYSGKLLVFEKAGAKTSMMLHKDRRKSWFVNAGKFKVTFIDIKTGQERSQVIEEGKTVDIAEMSPHQLEAMLPNSIILEVGMPDYEEDQFRIRPGDSQTRSLGQ